ncbi:dolichyl-phosphate-mannose-protein mannosyltransferase PMT1 Ecym_5615 [Eremothecium cymbalariae DBVPG|uniref:Dolichyl-phosphate-mannose--protein mannosyltransferase n=1 Tax=Eremothecium cymbalariae (strain CBS 270.75 / DBVPG 7215 / KCTC 17166 / NRRL Y-17582) TaxID=931890 RepID=I6NE59_ERECY|nr:hypothetical protein Ecym_5615 [Eremothecium cymbalariae DBVPG\
MSKDKEVKLDVEDPVLEMKTKKGPLRPFLVTEPDPKLSTLRTPNSAEERLLIGILLAVTVVVRFYRLSYPNSVVFDEVHFGGFASKYIRGAFFMDVHPPLAKMLFAGVASLTGFKGDFDFANIGDAYVSSVPYVLMRGFAAALGASTVLLMYLTLRASGVRTRVAFLSAICFAVENSFVTISRYILLDSPLIFFIAAAVYSFKRFELYPSNTIQSYKSLFATGMALGLALSSKWVGLFTVAWVGLLCIWRIWFQVGDLTMPISSIAKQASAKLFFLLVIPSIVYLLFFNIHFQALQNYSDGAGFFSSEFRTSLNGHSIPSNILADVGIGSTVTIRHVGTMGGYLHSHEHVYEGGSKQQQITLYPHLDHNNDWLIQYYNDTTRVPTTFEGLKDGTKIRLQHILTKHRLHSHDHKPPVSESSDWQKEVSAYGFEGFEGDANDDWIVEIDKDSSAPGEARERIRAIETKFRLKHAMTGCMLFSHEVKLPKWGFEQQEVTCATQGKPHLTLWYIEGNTNPLLPEDSARVSYKTPSFWSKLLEAHKRMWHINKNLKEPHVYQSDPLNWPLLLRGISYWAKDHRQVYFMGNAILWWAVTFFMAAFFGLCLRELFTWQLGNPILQDSRVLNFHIQVVHYLLGFAVHYAPSFLMSRQLFLHHYLPAYYFGILALAHGMDMIVSQISKKRASLGYGIIGVFVASVLYFFVQYRALIYGTPWTKDLCTKSQWMSGWDYGCGNFLHSYDDYKSLPEDASAAQLITPTDTVVEKNKAANDAKSERVDLDIDSLIADPAPKKFFDQHGKELPPEEVEHIVKEKGGQIMAVTSVTKNLL